MKKRGMQLTKDAKSLFGIATAIFILIVVLMMIVGLVDVTGRRYRIQVGDAIHYCNGYGYDDQGNLILKDCTGQSRDVIIRNPANVQIFEQ